MTPETTPWALAALTAALIPGGVSIVRMRRDLDNHETRMHAVEVRVDRGDAEIDGLRSAVGDLRVTVAAGFAELKTILVRMETRP